ncbi:MAG: hypothetical protein K2N89_06975 [Lachnospiraceae bacterium]|nr:hypothetical protein [Lachnospiraceae bacterium]
MRINFNVSSIVAKNSLGNNDSRLSESTLRLSSGYKINRASDNAAGLAIARKMKAQIRGIVRANENANDGISVVNTADGAMTEMHDILQRMNELSVQSANGTNSEDDRAKIQVEIDQLIQELDRIADTTQFNAQTLLDGTFAYKGYTNTENIKVMSYSDGVISGTYVIGTIKYTYTEKSITTYANNGKSVAKVENKESFQISSADDVRDALVMEKDLDSYKKDAENSTGLKAFPSDSLVSIEDEYVVIKASNDFEVKLAVNDKEALEATGLASTEVSTVTYSTSTYQKVYVTAPDGERYMIGKFTVGDDTALDHVSSENYKYVAEVLSDYFVAKGESNVKITDMTCDANGKMTITYDSSAGTDLPLDLNLSDPTVTMQDYLYQKEIISDTVYTVGSSDKDDCVAINLTGMGAMRVQVGANEGQYLDIEIPDLNTIYLGVNKLDVRTEDSATESINIVGRAINYLSAVRAKIGAYTNRLEHTVTNLDTTEENMTAAYSRIMDVDMAEEMTEYTTVQVLVQASTSMLAQANERPQQVLQLLQ